MTKAEPTPCAIVEPGFTDGVPIYHAPHQWPHWPVKQPVLQLGQFGDYLDWGTPHGE